MSDLNATPEVPNAPVVPEAASVSESVSAPASAESSVVLEHSAPVAAEPVEAPNVEPAAPVSAAASVPAEPVDQVSALSGEVAQTVHDLFTYVHEGFDQHSMMIGIARFYEIAKAVRARLES